MNPRHFLLLSPLLVMGCGTEETTLTPGAFINQYAAAVCAGVSPACLVTAEACTAVQVADRNQKAQDAVGLGRSFMPDAAQTCLNKVTGVFTVVKTSPVIKAADFQAMRQACDQVYRGLAKANSACAADADCTTGLICDKGYCGTKSVVQQGAGCANIGETCPAGSYCAVLPTLLRNCQPKIGLGGACDDSNPCLETLRCLVGVCSAQLGIGEVCSVDQDCSSGFCQPYADQCADDVRFADGAKACIEMGVL